MHASELTEKLLSSLRGGHIGDLQGDRSTICHGHRLGLPKTPTTCPVKARLVDWHSGSPYPWRRAGARQGGKIGVLGLLLPMSLLARFSRPPPSGTKNAAQLTGASRGTGVREQVSAMRMKSPSLGPTIETLSTVTVSLVELVRVTD